MQIRTKKLTPVGPPMTFFHSEDYTPENYDMEIAVPVLESNEGTRICEPHKCAKVNYIGLYDEMPKVYVQLQKWIDEHNFKLAGVPFDIYMTDPNTTSPEKNEVAVFFPIESK